MKKEISIWSCMACLISLIAFCLYVIVLKLDNSIIAIFFAWIILSLGSPLFPILAKFFRNRKEKHGERLEILALIIGSYNFYVIFFLLTKINMYIVFAMIAVICIAYVKLFNYLPAKRTTNTTNYGANTSPIDWKCSCGRTHPKYESACVCGKSKIDILNQQKSEGTAACSDVSAETQDQILFCRKCGNKLIKGASFCGKCGTQVMKE